MKKLNKKGFTLIELLAVITIMGILMLVAIPAIQRTIENSRRDTFADTAKNYANAVRTMWLSDSFTCRTFGSGATVNAAPTTLPSALGNGAYYVLISSQYQGNNYGTDSTSFFKPFPYLLQQGGKSSWSGRQVTGIVRITVSNAGSNKSTQKYEIAMTDGVHGFTAFKDAETLKRSDVSIASATAVISNPTAPSAAIGGGLGGLSAATIQEHLCQES